MDVVNVQFYAGYVEVRFCDSDERTLDIETSKVVGLKQLEGNIEEILH